MRTRTTWREKLEKPQEPKVVRIPAKMQRRFGTGTMLIARPLDVDARIRQVPKGRLITQSQIREDLARDAGADTACPITTGIFIRIVAEAAAEDLACFALLASDARRQQLIDSFQAASRLRQRA